MDNSGSFNANGGGNGSLIADAMKRLNIGSGSVLNQNSTSPSAVMQPSVPASGAPGVPPPVNTTGGDTQPVGIGGSMAQQENAIILRALEQKLKSNAAIESAQAGVQK